MKRISLIVAVLCACSLAPASVITLNPSGDAGIQKFSWNTGDENWGSATQLWNASVSAYGGNAYSLIKWDFSTVPTDAIVTSATLRMYYSWPLTNGDLPTGRQCWFQQVNESWNEMTVTHNTLPAIGSGIFSFVVGPTWANVGTYQEWNSDDLKNWVSAAISDNTLAANGWYMAGPQEDNSGATFDSREATYKPELVIEYVIPEPATVTILLLGAIGLLRKNR